MTFGEKESSIEVWKFSLNFPNPGMNRSTLLIRTRHIRIRIHAVECGNNNQVKPWLTALTFLQWETADSEVPKQILVSLRILSSRKMQRESRMRCQQTNKTANPNEKKTCELVRRTRCLSDTVCSSRSMTWIGNYISSNSFNIALFAFALLYMIWQTPKWPCWSTIERPRHGAGYIGRGLQRRGITNESMQIHQMRW